MVVDGRLDEPVWARVPPVGDFLLNDGSGQPQLPTELRICWDDSNLYLAFIAVDTDIWGAYRQRDDPVWEEEVVEAFISSGGDVTRPSSAEGGRAATDAADPLGRRPSLRLALRATANYFEFNFSPHNVVFDARIEIPENGDRAQMKSDIAWNCEGLRSVVRVVGTLDRHDDLDERWTVEAAIPFCQIGRDGRTPRKGERWRANFYRIDRAGDGEFSAWSPTLVPNFHVPARFGHLVFSTEAT